MKPTIYLETSIIGYVASRPSRDLIAAANQQMSREWWDEHRGRYETYVSQAVVDECSRGDPAAAQERLRLLVGVPRLTLTEPAERLASALLNLVPLPEKARIDALHIALSAVHGIEYLLTWNCTHIANATLRGGIVESCEAAGVAAPIICTPQELMEM